MARAASTSGPSHILIVGADVFGLSTTLAFLERPEYSNANITLIDAVPDLPNCSAASVDSSRILRADYALRPYTKIVSESQRHFQDQGPCGWGAQGRYHEAKLILTAEPGTEDHVDGYLEESFDTIRGLARSGELKIGRHGYGYQNPTLVSIADLQGGGLLEALASVPRIDLPVPPEGQPALREFFVKIPSGDFLLDYYPHACGLFLATNDSGHAFKVFPVIGDKVVDAISGCLPADLHELWKWREEVAAVFQGTDDGTRGGPRGLILEHEHQGRDTSPITNL
ncbi:hypothetical protein BDV26DRAFT_292350 [Aspergillus bertholletiae]|uniref:FAD dependent oxidoreductase domain-containing protein n=1 Tax=Aspergillus bertholletiae TaxID=1226010 RepID=A0A5N7B914_9EURO|nr:hypothetical protein BDV26DRAFT_292350 [Aspergillus bertholletiae]